ncbi:hypothetical protein KW837_26665 [Pseudomonas sp. PDM24]|uniref:hypothetical protein n=1 Tax=Pseudomonas sp. PDM24 TaxID=2854777 RepID=UPI001C4708F4|nr:hypothetical protein [Pseudomonas sp. PDM24]MBV7497857.1 hypothetical protein [Pseudomonas sp. PDM24]
MSTKSKSKTVRINAAAKRQNPPGFANSFALSTLHNEVIVFDFADIEDGYENIFSSVALTKFAAKSLSRHLVELLETIDEEQEEEVDEQA